MGPELAEVESEDAIGGREGRACLPAFGHGHHNTISTSVCPSRRTDPAVDRV